MALPDRISSLKSKHEYLEYSLKHEMNRPHPDPILIQDLKMRKLRVREEMLRLQKRK